jgi:hypothetical protein
VTGRVASAPSAVVKAAGVGYDCFIPRLKGKTLGAARAALAKAHCTVGQV